MNLRNPFHTQSTNLLHEVSIYYNQMVTAWVTINMISKLISLILLIVILTSCQTREWDNPFSTTIIFNPSLTYGTLTDIDGNIYKTIQIGTQTWMAQNLKTTKYRNGDKIPNVTENASWAALATGAYCWYDNHISNKATYGGLYNWYAVTDIRNIAPTGWHLPTDAEWTTLTTYLGGENVAGGKLKETGTTHWFFPNTGATNSSGFTALPEGYRYGYNSSFELVGYDGYWWSSTASNASDVWNRYLYYDKYYVYRNGYHKQFGFSVRCVRD